MTLFNPSRRALQGMRPSLEPQPIVALGNSTRPRKRVTLSSCTCKKNAFSVGIFGRRNHSSTNNNSAPSPYIEDWYVNFSYSNLLKSCCRNAYWTTFTQDSLANLKRLPRRTAHLSGFGQLPRMPSFILHNKPMARSNDATFTISIYRDAYSWKKPFPKTLPLPSRMNDF